MYRKISQYIDTIGQFIGRLFNQNTGNSNSIGQRIGQAIAFEKKALEQLHPKRIPTIRQIKYSWRVLHTTERIQITRLAIVWLIITITFGVVFVFNRTEPVAAVGGTYTEGFLQEPQFLNPVLAFNNDTDVNLNRLVFASLLRMNANLELEPDLASTYDISEDQKTYTITLKNNLFWHDGEPLTIDDVIFTIETIQNDQYNSPHSGKFKGVQLKKINDVTLQFILEQPFTPFLYNLTVGIIPKHIWQTIPPNNSRLAEANLKPIGAGPYQFTKLQKDRNGTILSYTFERFDGYHGTKPFIETLQFKFYPNITAALDALQKQNIDGLEFLPKNNKQDAATIKSLQFHTFSLPQYTAVFINHVRNSQLEDVRVRQALTYAINKQTLVNETLSGEAQVIEGPILPGAIGYNETWQPYNYSTSTAGDLLEAAGWQFIAEQPWRQKDDQTLEITLTTVDVADTISVAENIRNYWQAIGVKTNLEVVPKSVIDREIILPRNYQALLFGQILGADPDLFPFWHSTKRHSPGVNLTNFANQQADALLEQGRSTTDIAEREKAYTEFQELLLTDAPAIFLYSPTYIYPVLDKVRGIDQTRITTPADRFNSIDQWYIKTTRRWSGW